MHIRKEFPPEPGNAVPGGGRKGALPSVRDKLLSVLYYFKVYPTSDVPGTQSGMSHPKANENLHGLCPVLYGTPVYLKVMPYREFRTPDGLMKALNGIGTILTDVTERDHRRLKDDAAQRGHYSGKKKTCRQKHCDGGPR